MTVKCLGCGLEFIVALDDIAEQCPACGSWDLEGE